MPDECAASGDRSPIPMHSVFQLLNYKPHPGQREFHASSARFKVLIAGARFGKSLAAAREVLPFLFVPNSRGWIAAPSYRLGEKEFRYIFDDLNTLGIPLRKKLLGGANGPSHLRTHNGAEVLVVSAAEPANLLGEELDWLLLSEASQLPEEVYTRYLRARLTSRRGKLIVPTTPRGFNWIHDLYLRGHDSSHPEWQSFLFKTADNPLIPAEEIEEARRTLPADQFQEQYEGGFVTRSGLVYPEFSPSVHVSEDAERIVERASFSVDRYGAIDFGYSNPFVCLFAAVLSGGRVIVYDEYYAAHRTLPAHLPDLIERGADRARAIYCDPSGPAWMAELRNQGLRVQASRNTVGYGIDLVRRRLLPGDDGTPGLLIHPRCVNTIREFTRYRYADDRDTKGELRPLKEDDHAMDALRYLCLSLDSGVKWQAL